MTVTLIELPERPATADLEALTHLYNAVFTQPPYDEPPRSAERFAASFEQQRRRPGFRGYVALSNAQTIGLAYGYASQPGEWWHTTATRELAPALYTRWFTDCFEFVQLAVHPSWQGHGLGGRLHDALVAGVTQATAVLCTLHAETAALALYNRRGWLTIREDITFPGSTHRYALLGLDLTARSGDA